MVRSNHLSIDVKGIYIGVNLNTSSPRQYHWINNKANQPGDPGPGLSVCRNDSPGPWAQSDKRRELLLIISTQLVISCTNINLAQASSGSGLREQQCRICGNVSIQHNLQLTNRYTRCLNWGHTRLPEIVHNFQVLY